MRFDSYQYQYRDINNPYPRSIIYPRFNVPIRKASTINLSKILETTQRGINTINQIVPIYKQVTPIVKQVSNFTKSFTSFISNGFRTTSNSNKSNIDQDIKTSSYQNSEYRNNSSPNNPFFKEK